MKLFTADQIKRWDKATIEKGILSLDLMERAASELAGFISDNFDKETHIVIFAGPGNNGGDALAVSRLLSGQGFSQLETFIVAGSSMSLSPDCEANRKRLTKVFRCTSEDALPDLSDLSRADLIIDGLFGTGLSRPLESIYSKCVSQMNRSEALIVSIDIPSGVYADELLPESSVCIRADLVLTFQIPKRVFLFPESQRFMEAFKVLDIGLDEAFHNAEPCDRFYLEESMTRIPERAKFSHKGNYGHAYLVSGSRGMYGALELCAKACLKSGVGLLTVHGPGEAMAILQGTIPEAMYSSDREGDVVSVLPSLESASALACGPGLGLSPMACGLVDQVLSEVRVPLVLDADALNIIAQESWQSRIPKDTIITPHPKEFERLFGSCETSPESIELQSSKSKELGIIIIRKGAHSTVSLPNGTVYFNSTGNPFMATGGMGDVLTGILLGFLAQGLNSEESACTAVYNHGLAADRLIGLRGGGVTASDVIESLPYTMWH